MTSTKLNTILVIGLSSDAMPSNIVLGQIFVKRDTDTLNAGTQEMQQCKQKYF